VESFSNTRVICERPYIADYVEAELERGSNHKTTSSGNPLMAIDISSIISAASCYLKNFT
jgi:hypothetical protein